MAKKELITACRATFKNGDTKEYNTIEEASEDTGLSVASKVISEQNTFFPSSAP